MEKKATQFFVVSLLFMLGIVNAQETFLKQEMIPENAIEQEMIPENAIEQPIAFSHQLHATENQIPCQYCHIYARRSHSSGIPSMNICIGCHGTKQMPIIAPDSVEVAKLRDYWEKKEPVPWQKVHDLPDFVRFPHKAHINASPERFVEGAESACDLNQDPRSTACKIKLFKAGGDVRCQSCHGDVQSMPVVYQVDQNFGEMGWCLNCHLQVKGAKARKSLTSTMGAWLHFQEEEKEREKKMDLFNPKGYHNPNLSDCAACHY